MKLFYVVLAIFKTLNACSYFSLFDYRYATTKNEYKYDYEKINIESVREPIDAKEEAIMLIGGTKVFHRFSVVMIKESISSRQISTTFNSLISGKMCTDAECSVEYYRSGSGSFDINDIGGTSTIKRRVPSFDRTV